MATVMAVTVTAMMAVVVMGDSSGGYGDSNSSSGSNVDSNGGSGGGSGSNGDSDGGGNNPKYLF
jgi:hypothetical protein